ncbi:MAG TPA: Ku protein [Gammaproteobacteria bacterium]|nr:Ku protein [Gammaproteobacteria bacterium]
MAQAIWTGHISFGLVNIPVALYSAERKTDLSFRMLDSRNRARIRYERINDETGDEVPWDKIVKGFEFEKGNYVLLDNEDFERAAPEATQSIEIESFVELAAIEYAYFERPYVLEPESHGEKGYVLLRDTLRETGRAGIAKVVIRTRQHLAALVASERALILNLLRFHQELRSAEDFKLPDEEKKGFRISAAEKKMAKQLVESMSGEWKPDFWHDDYRAALLEYIEQKARKGKVAAEPKAKPRKKAQVIDLTERLRKSLEQSGGRKGGASKKTAARKRSGAKRKAASR